MSKGVCWRFGQGLVALSLLVACSANSDPAGSGDTGGKPSGVSGSATVLGGMPSLPGGGGLVIPGAGGSSAGSGRGDPSCATVPLTAMVTRAPVDIVVVIDNSGSMQDEIDAVEKNLNVNFANILQTSGVDYRVILISRH